MKRIIKHLMTPHWIARRAFSRAALKRIEGAIRSSEKSHDGELRFAVEGGLPLNALLGRVTSHQRAREVFSQLGVWDTRHNSGVLVYLQLVDRHIEIIADRGISARVDQAQWDAICRRMEEAFRSGRFEQGVLDGMGEITGLLARHFPARGDNPDELANRPVVL